jgi:hypothetical protein
MSGAARSLLASLQGLKPGTPWCCPANSLPARALSQATLRSSGLTKGPRALVFRQRGQAPGVPKFHMFPQKPE